MSDKEIERPNKPLPMVPRLDEKELLAKRDVIMDKARINTLKVSPRMGDHRNSPMVKRKKSPSKSRLSQQSDKALKMLGVNGVEEKNMSEVVTSPKGRKESLRRPKRGSGMFGKKSPQIGRHQQGDIFGDVIVNPNDSVDDLREKMDMVRARYEKWKRQLMDDTRKQLQVMQEELLEAQKEAAEANKHANAWKSSYEAMKDQLTVATRTWIEEKSKMEKRFNSDQVRIAKMKKALADVRKGGARGGAKKSGKPQGLPRYDVVPVSTRVPANKINRNKQSDKRVVQVGRPRLLAKEKDSAPMQLNLGESGGGVEDAFKDNEIRKVEDFAICAKIGQGGFGAVFLGREKKSGMVVAIKRMSKRRIIAKKQVHTVNVEVDVLKQTRMEKSHWIVQLHFALSDPHYIYLAMEFCGGGDLRNLIDNVELEETGARFFCAEIIISVNSLHDRGFVHRDLKPSNFLITSRGHLKLADFGLSKSSGEKEKKGDDKAQGIRVFLEDGSYKTLVVNNATTCSEAIKNLKQKCRAPKNAPFLIFEVNELNGLTRERPMSLEEKPLVVASLWQKGFKYKFVFKEADALRVAAMARNRPERSHRDPFFEGKTKKKGRDRLYSVVGSPHYMAAEILQGSGYETVVDWWSVGCILYEIICGVPPFTGATAEEVFAAVLNSKETLQFPENRDISDEVKDIIRKFLSPPEKRLGYNGIGEIKQHPFFESVNWNAVHLMETPFVPCMDDDLDFGYFEAATTEGIDENFRMDGDEDLDDPTPLDAEDDPWAKGWDWSAV